MNIRERIRRFSPGLAHYLFAGVLLVRLVNLARLSGSPLFLPSRGDMHFYNDWAFRILRGELDLHTAFYGLPLYAYGLAGIYRIFGSSPFIPGILQALIDSGTAVLIYLLTLHLFQNTRPRDTSARHSPATDLRVRQGFAALGAVGWALFVPAQAYSVILMPTAWFIFVFWLLVWRLVVSNKAPGRTDALLFGGLIGFAAMAIATALFLIPLFVAGLILRRGSIVWRQVLLNGTLFLAAVAIGMSPCWVHNYFLAHDPVLLSAHGGVNFWIGNNPTANGYPKFPPGMRAGQAAMLEDSIASAETAAGRPLKRAEVSAYWSAKAWNYIGTHTSEWIRLLLIKARNFWNAFQYDDLSIITNLREQGVIFPGLYFGMVAVLALPGMVFAWRCAPAARWIMAAVLLHMAALMPVFVTERYRLPVVPGLLILASYGIWILWRGLAAAEYRAAIVYASTLAVAAFVVSWPQRDPALWALDAYNSGWQALECGNLPLAESKLTLARHYVPTNPETNFALGNLRLAQNNKPDAASFYLSTLAYDSTHRGALNNLAVIALDENRYDLAEGWLRRAENIEPANAKTHFLLGKVLLGKGDRIAAQLEAGRAVALDPAQPEFKQFSEKLKALDFN